MKKSAVVGAVLAILVLIGMNFVPESIGLSRAGINTLGVLIAVVLALVLEPLPIGVTCILGIALIVIFGVRENLAGALSGYTHYIGYFVLISFGVSQAIANVPLSSRLLQFTIRLFGKKTQNILFSFMLSSAILSSIMSNVATTAVLLTVVMSFLNVYDEEERKRSGKAFLIGMPVASMIGGMMTPAGSPLNMLGMDFLVGAGINITFVQWMLIGIPISIVTLLIAWKVTMLVFKPAEIDPDRLDSYINGLQIPKKMSGREAYVLIVVLSLFTLWVLSSWFPVLNITVVGIIGFAALMIPKANIMSWKNYVNSVSWSSFFLIGTMMTLGSALSTNGVSDWLVATLFRNKINLPVFFVVALICLIVFVLLIPIPIGPALISMLGAPFVGMAISWGYNPALLIMPLVLCGSCCFLLPLDTVTLLTYSTGYYKMTDMPKATLWIQLCMIPLIAAWVPISLKILGFM